MRWRSRAAPGVVLLLGLALAAWAAGDFAAYLVERQVLRAEAAEVVRHAAGVHDRVEAIVHDVQARVSPGERPLPVLRSPALETWITGEGHCGDAARVIVLMLRSVGIDARRIYLRAHPDDYFHVAVAYQLGGQTYLVDSVNSTSAFKEFVSRHRRQALAETGVPNDQFYAYSYVNWGRVLPFVELDHTASLPGPLVTMMESPFLVLALVKTCLGAGALLLPRWLAA
jgi:Transglutaminase-like superfamily